MKGIVLAGGSGTRLYPITLGVSKQLLPVYDKPMIYYPLSILMQAKIRDILIITTPDDQAGFKKLLGDGSRFGINLVYAVQEKPNGIAEAFIIGKEFVGDDSVCLVLGDNIFNGANIEKKLLAAKSIVEEDDRAVVFGYEVSDPERYGVAEVIGKVASFSVCTVKSIEEKPQNPKSNIAVTGLYFYPNSVLQKAKEIQPSARGELEITTVNQEYLKEEKLSLTVLDRGFAWLDTGTFESLNDAASYVATIEKRQGVQIACLEEIGYKNKWLTKSQLNEIIEQLGKNSYKEYLKKLIIKKGA